MHQHHHLGGVWFDYVVASGAVQSLGRHYFGRWICLISRVGFDALRARVCREHETRALQWLVSVGTLERFARRDFSTELAETDRVLYCQLRKQITRSFLRRGDALLLRKLDSLADWQCTLAARLAAGS